MKSFKFLLMVMFSAAVLVGCKKKATSNAGNDTDTPAVAAKSMHEKFAADMCKCSSEMLDMGETMQALTASGDTDALNNMLEKFESVQAEAEKCTEALQTKYPDISEENEADEEAVMSAMKTECPKFAKMMEAMMGEMGE